MINSTGEKSRVRDVITKCVCVGGGGGGHISLSCQLPVKFLVLIYMFITYF